MSISTPFIHRPIATSLLMAAILLAGIISYTALPIAPLPQVDYPTIVVSANLPGASPETMASSIATPLERQFAQISGVAQMTSSSALGLTNITLQFDLERNIDAAAQDIQAAINAASGQLSKNLPNPPVFRKVNPADSPIFIIGVSSDNHPIIDTNDYADTILAQQISQISGVAQVLILGEQKPSVRVQIDPVKLASVRLGLEEVRAALAAATVDVPKGSLDGLAQSFTIYNDDQLLRAEGYNDIIVGFRNGSPIRIRDLGIAVDAPENTRITGWLNGRRGMQLAIFRQGGANVIETVGRIKSALPRLQAALPPGIDVTIMTDRTQTIRASVEDVQITMALKSPGTACHHLSCTILVSARILDSGLVLLFYFAGGSNLAKMPVHKLLYVRHTVEFQQLHVLFHPPVQRHAHLPRTGVDLGIVDSHFIEKRILAGACVTLSEVQCVAMIVS
jgi:multidrug efflux pump subunit AcrB